ncbi:MAG: DsrE family protein [Candidatus Lokiarchaeota archaeon]|nr:DsrE family protein [Candidatus Lokiarchaeota archaeon]
MIKSVVIISDQSPIGRNSAIEAIRIGSGFTALGEYIDCKVVFTGDAVYLFNKYCNPEAVGMDSLTEVLEMADLSDLEVYIIESALTEAGLTKDDLIEYENLKIINYDDLTELIADADTSFRF